MIPMSVALYTALVVEATFELQASSLIHATDHNQIP